ncbi:hypothetical protein ACVRXS_09470 [Streptococcus orisratti]
MHRNPKVIAQKTIQKQADVQLTIKEIRSRYWRYPHLFEIDKTEIVGSYETVEKADCQIEVRRYKVIHGVDWLHRKAY